MIIRRRDGKNKSFVKLGYKAIRVGKRTAHAYGGVWCKHGGERVKRTPQERLASATLFYREYFNNIRTGESPWSGMPGRSSWPGMLNFIDDDEEFEDY